MDLDVLNKCEQINTSHYSILTQIKSSCSLLGLVEKNVQFEVTDKKTSMSEVDRSSFALLAKHFKKH